MSVRTKAMTHFISAAGGFVDNELSYLKRAEGLADTLKTGVDELVKDHGLENLVVEFDKAMIEAEAAVKEKLPDGVTLSKFCSAWRVRKSALKGCIGDGLDPLKYATYTKFVAARKKMNDEKSGGADSGKGYTPHDSKGGLDGGSTTSAKIAEHTSAMPAKAQAKLDASILELTKLFEADANAAYAAMKVFDSCIETKLKACGARFAKAA